MITFVMRRPRRALPVAALAAAALTLIGAAPAAAVSCANLQTALTGATAGSTVQLDAGSQCTGTSYTLPSLAITFDGNGSTLDGGAVNTPVLAGAAVGATTIENLTVENGSLTNAGGGAGIRITEGSTPTLTNDKLFANHTTDISGNGNGGGVDILSTATSGTISITNSVFGSAAQPNTASNNGGGLFVSGPPAVTLQGDTFTANTSDEAGGGAELDPEGAAPALTLTQDSFSGNSSTIFGGGASIDFAGASGGARPAATLTGDSFTSNVLSPGDGDEDGAGLFITGFDGSGSLSQQGDLFASNSMRTTLTRTIGEEGAGEFAAGIPLTSTDDRFIGNQMTSVTAADSLEGAGLAFEGCGAGGSGGGTPATLINAIAAGNTIPAPGPASGSGVYVGGCGSGNVALTLLDSTISGNTAAGGGDGGLGGDLPDTLTARNSIVAGNGGSTDLNGFASRTVDHTDICSFGVVLAGAANECVSPALLNPFGGDVHETTASPTIDAGANADVPAGLTTDALGAARISDGHSTGSAVVDEGAIEAPAGFAPRITPSRPAPPVCVVPKLTGKTKGSAARLEKRAKTLLARAHCALGRVSEPKRQHKHGKLVPLGTLVVAAQGKRAGTHERAGFKVAIRLGHAPKPKPRHPAKGKR
jgi:hypothetical protein